MRRYLLPAVLLIVLLMLCVACSGALVQQLQADREWDHQRLAAQDARIEALSDQQTLNNQNYYALLATLASMKESSVQAGQALPQPPANTSGASFQTSAGGTLWASNALVIGIIVIVSLFLILAALKLLNSQGN
jgi:hypothetical protein